MSRRKKLPQDVIRATTHALSNDGRGIASINGKVTFIEGALPDEIVDFKYAKVKRHYDEARAMAIINPSIHRVKPKCPYADICGGCTLQHLSSAQQLQSKQDLFLETLKRLGGVVPLNLLAPLQQSIYAYRSKARLSVRFVEKKSTVLIGFRERQSSYVVDMNSCAVLDARVGENILLLRELVDQLEIKRDIPQIEIAMSEKIVCLIFRVMQHPQKADIQKLKTFSQQHQFRFLLQPAGLESLCDLDFNAVDDERLSYQIDNDSIEMHFHPLDFTQVNVSVNRAMILQAMLLLNPQADETVLDLFCGLGNFSLPLARRAKSVVGVEGSAAMVGRAEENATSNAIFNTEFYSANLTTEASYESDWAKRKYQKILIDPPRTGALEVMPFVGKQEAQSVLYISCDPATLARDASILVKEYGYQAQTAGIMDMFPHTSHIESMILFTK